MGKKNKDKENCECCDNSGAVPELYDTIYLQIDVKADNVKNSVTVYRDEDNLVGVTWQELAYNFQLVLKGMGYTFSDEMDETWQDLINSGIKTLV